MNTWFLNLHVQKKKTRTPCGELVWRSNMRRCRFEDGSRYCPSTCKWYFRFYQISKSFQECLRIWLAKFKDRFLYEQFFFFSPRSWRKYRFVRKRQRKEKCQLAKGLKKEKKKKTRAGMEKDECTVGNRLLHMQLASLSCLDWGSVNAARKLQLESTKPYSQSAPDGRTKGLKVTACEHRDKKRFNFNIRVQEPI